MNDSAGLAPRSVRVSGAHGLAINMWDFGGQGPPLLLSHCTGTHGRMWDPLVPRFLPRFHVYAPDTRGHGDSCAPPTPDDCAWNLSGDDLAAVVDHLGISSGVRAIGHSAGAAHIACLALLRPAVFERAVLIDPIIFPRNALEGPNLLAEASRRRKNVFNSRAEAIERYASKPPMNTWRRDALEAYVEFGFRDRADGRVELKCPGPLEAEFYMRSAASDVFERLHEISIDVMLITGDRSDIRQLAEHQSARLPKVDFHVLEGLTHFVPQENPDLIADLALSFFG